MKVYIASSFDNRMSIRSLIDVLTRDGHTVTHNWTHDDDSGMHGIMKEKYLESCALKDVDGVNDADAFIIVDHPKARGAYTELGIAIQREIPILANVVDTENSERGLQIFMNLPGIQFWETEEQLLADLDNLAHG